MVVRVVLGCDATEPVAWLEKRRCDITLGRKASCSLTTLGMLMESSEAGTSQDGELRFARRFKYDNWGKKEAFLTLFIVLVGAAERVLRGLARRLAVLLPNGAGARVRPRHGGQTEAVGRRRGADGADGCFSLICC